MDTDILSIGAADTSEAVGEAVSMAATPQAGVAESEADSSVSAAAAVATAATISPLIDVHGNFVGKAWAGEDERLADKFTSIGALAKSYRTLEQMVARQDKVSVPSEGASEEELSTFYAKLGRPESPEGYEIKHEAFPEELREYEEAVHDEASLAEYRKVAHEVGLTPRQAQAIASMHFRQVQGTLAQITEAQHRERSEAVAELARGWGTAADSEAFKQNLALARAGAKVLGLSEEVLSASPQLANNAHFIRAMHAAAKMTKEAPAVAAREAAPLSGNAIEARVNAILQNPEHAYWRADHPAHRQAVVEMQSLMEKRVY